MALQDPDAVRIRKPVIGAGRARYMNGGNIIWVI